MPDNTNSISPRSKTNCWISLDSSTGIADTSSQIRLPSFLAHLQQPLVRPEPGVRPGQHLALRLQQVVQLDREPGTGRGEANTIRHDNEMHGELGVIGHSMKD